MECITVAAHISRSAVTVKAIRAEEIPTFFENILTKHRQACGTKYRTSSIIAVINLSKIRILRMKGKVWDQLVDGDSVWLVTNQEWSEYCEKVLDQEHLFRHGKRVVSRHPSALSYEKLQHFVSQFYEGTKPVDPLRRFSSPPPPSASPFKNSSPVKKHYQLVTSPNTEKPSYGHYYQHSPNKMIADSKVIDAVRASLSPKIGSNLPPLKRGSPVKSQQPLAARYSPYGETSSSVQPQVQLPEYSPIFGNKSNDISEMYSEYKAGLANLDLSTVPQNSWIHQNKFQDDRLPDRSKSQEEQGVTENKNQDLSVEEFPNGWTSLASEYQESEGVTNKEHERKLPWNREEMQEETKSAPVFHHHSRLPRPFSYRLDPSKTTTDSAVAVFNLDDFVEEDEAGVLTSNTQSMDEGVVVIHDHSKEESNVPIFTSVDMSKAALMSFSAPEPASGLSAFDVADGLYPVVIKEHSHLPPLHKEDKDTAKRFSQHVGPRDIDEHDTSSVNSEAFNDCVSSLDNRNDDLYDRTFREDVGRKIVNSLTEDIIPAKKSVSRTVVIPDDSSVSSNEDKENAGRKKNYLSSDVTTDFPKDDLFDKNAEQELFSQTEIESVNHLLDQLLERKLVSQPLHCASERDRNATEDDAEEDIQEKKDDECSLSVTENLPGSDSGFVPLKHTEEILSKALADVSQDEDDLGISNHVAVEMQHDEPCLEMFTPQVGQAIMSSDNEENASSLLRDEDVNSRSQQLQTVLEDEEFVSNSNTHILSSKSGSPPRKLKDLHPIVISRDNRDFSLDDEIPGFYGLPNQHPYSQHHEDVNMSIDSGEGSIYTKYRRQTNELQELKSVKVALEARLEEARYLLQMFAGLPSTRSRHNLRSIGSEKDLALSPFSHFPTIIDELEDTIKDISIETVDKPHRPRAFFKDPDPREISRDSTLTSTPEEPNVHQPRRASKVEHKIPEGIFHPHAPVSPILEATLHHHDIYQHEGNRHHHEKHVTYSDEHQMYPPVNEETILPSTNHLEKHSLNNVNGNQLQSDPPPLTDINYLEDNELGPPREVSPSSQDDTSQSLHSDRDVDRSPPGSKSSSLLKKIETLKLRRKGLAPNSQAIGELQSLKYSETEPINGIPFPAGISEIQQTSHPLSLQTPISDEQHGVFTKHRASPRTSKILLGKLSPTVRSENKGSPRESSTVVTSVSIQLPEGLSEPSPEQVENKSFASPDASPRDSAKMTELGDSPKFTAKTVQKIEKMDATGENCGTTAVDRENTLSLDEKLLQELKPTKLTKENEKLDNHKESSEEKIMNSKLGSERNINQMEVLSPVLIVKDIVDQIKTSGPPPLPFDEEVELRVNAKHSFPASFNNSLHYNDQNNGHGDTPIDYVYFGRDEVISPLSMNSDLLEAEKKMESSFSEPVSENRENAQSKHKPRAVASAKKEPRTVPSNSYLDSYNRAVQTNSTNNSRSSNKNKSQGSSSKDPSSARKKDTSLPNSRVLSDSPSVDTPAKNRAASDSSPLVAVMKPVLQPLNEAHSSIHVVNLENLEKSTIQFNSGNDTIPKNTVPLEKAEDKAVYVESAPPSPPPLSPKMEIPFENEEEVVFNEQVLPPSFPAVEESHPPPPPAEDEEERTEKQEPVLSSIDARSDVEEVREVMVDQLNGDEEIISSSDMKKPDLQVDVNEQHTTVDDPVERRVFDVVSPCVAPHDVVSPLSNNADSPLANNDSNLQGLEHLTHYYLPFLIASKYLDDSSLRGSKARRQLLSSIHYPEIILWLIFQSYGTSDGILVKQIK
jgi:hypothetical protein